VDQQWLDLAPGLFAGVHIERNPGWNVARWNLAGRRVERRGEDYTVNSEPLLFYHFTQVRPGIDFKDYFWGMEISPALDEIVTAFVTGLRAKGYTGGPTSLETQWDCFPNGRKIPALFRQIMRDTTATADESEIINPRIPPSEAMRRLAANGTTAGGRLRAVAYHQAKVRRLGTADERVSKYSRSPWYRRWVNSWFYLFAPRVLNVPVEWIEPNTLRRGLRALLDVPARVASQFLRKMGR
jgi:hypothetical protein